MISITTIGSTFIFMIILGFILYNIKKRGIDALSLLLVGIALILLSMIIFEQMTYDLINSLGFWRPEIAFLSIVSITAFVLAVKSYFNQREIEKEITILSREIALREKKG